MSNIALILQAVQVLEPLVTALAKHLAGGPPPEFLTTIPSPLKSQVALNLRKATHQ